MRRGFVLFYRKIYVYFREKQRQSDRQGSRHAWTIREGERRVHSEWSHK